MSYLLGIRHYIYIYRRLCPNTTGADLRSVCTEAGMFAIRARRKAINEKDLLEAIEKVFIFLVISFRSLRGIVSSPQPRSTWFITDSKYIHNIIIQYYSLLFSLVFNFKCIKCTLLSTNYIYVE
jgi:hypothetical protein